MLPSFFPLGGASLRLRLEGRGLMVKLVSRVVLVSSMDVVCCYPVYRTGTLLSVEGRLLISGTSGTLGKTLTYRHKVDCCVGVMAGL